MNHGIIYSNNDNKPIALVRLRKPMVGKYGVGFSYRGPYVLVGIISSKPRTTALPKPFFRTVFGHVLDDKGYYIETYEESQYDMAKTKLSLPVFLL